MFPWVCFSSSLWSYAFMGLLMFIFILYFHYKLLHYWLLQIFFKALLSVFQSTPQHFPPLRSKGYISGNYKETNTLCFGWRSNILAVRSRGTSFRWLPELNKTSTGLHLAPGTGKTPVTLQSSLTMQEGKMLSLQSS